MKAIVKYATINGNNISFLQNVFTWKPMHNYRINRDTKRKRKPGISLRAFIALERRNSTVIPDKLLSKNVQIKGFDTYRNASGYLSVQAGQNIPTLPDRLNLLRRFTDDIFLDFQHLNLILQLFLLAD